MSTRSKYAAAWLAIVLIAVSIVGIVAVPVWLIQPFAPQTQRSLDISYLFRSWSPTFTILACATLLLLAVYVRSNSRRWFAKAALILPFLVVLPFTWLSRQNHFEWMFNPLPNAAYAKTSDAGFMSDSDMVLAVENQGETAAYPIRLMAYHHVVQDTVGGTPLVATY